MCCFVCLYVEPVQTGCADSALVASDLLCDVDGVSVPQTDSAGPAEVLPKPQPLTALALHLMSERGLLLCEEAWQWGQNYHIFIFIFNIYGYLAVSGNVVSRLFPLPFLSILPQSNRCLWGWSWVFVFMVYGKTHSGHFSSFSPSSRKSQAMCITDVCSFYFSAVSFFLLLHEFFVSAVKKCLNEYRK